MVQTKLTTAESNLAASNAMAGIPSVPVMASQTTPPINDHLVIAAGMTAVSHNNIVPICLKNVTLNVPKPLNNTESIIQRCLIYKKVSWTVKGWASPTKPSWTTLVP